MILFLGPSDSPVVLWLRSKGEIVFQWDEPIVVESFIAKRYSSLISYGYRYKIPKEVYQPFWGNAINLHISYLPWNRGADPNLWSHLTGTPKGVSIHLITDTIDGGPVYYQKEVDLSSPGATLATTYAKLHEEMVQLFKDKWEDFKNGRHPDLRCQNLDEGSAHKTKDREMVKDLLEPLGWDTPISELESWAEETAMSAQARDNEIEDIAKMKKDPS